MQQSLNISRSVPSDLGRSDLVLNWRRHHHSTAQLTRAKLHPEVLLVWGASPATNKKMRSTVNPQFFNWKSLKVVKNCVLKLESRAGITKIDSGV
jgi:hypothetical protein